MKKNINMESNSQKINNNNNQTNNSDSQNNSLKYEKSKELLMKLLKEKLDTRLFKLEKRHKNHFTTMRSTTQDIKIITEWSISANKQIRDKLKKDKEKQQPKSNISKSKIISSKSSNLKTKTPLRTKSTKSFIFEETKSNISRNKGQNKSLMSSKTTKTLGNRAKSFSILNRKKNSNRPTNNLNVIGNDALRRPSVVSNKSNKSNKSSKTAIISKTPKYKKNNTKVTNKNVTPVRKKTPFKKRNNTVLEKNENTLNTFKNLANNISKENVSTNRTEIPRKNEENKVIEIDQFNMNKMESALQKDDLLNNNDPLLISPITEFDFYQNGKISNTNTINSDINENKFNANISKIFNDKLYNIITDYLSINDLIQFKNSSKIIHKLFKDYILNKLKKEKEYFINKKSSLNLDQNNIPKVLTIKDFSLSKGSIKAISLLNEPHLNYLFFEESPADEDRLIIYRIFFQLINHPYKYIPTDKKEEFWKKCQNYFSDINNGKTGDILKNAVENNNIDIEGNNLYKIYKLANNNLNKIYPSYYSKSCGTTGLFTFFIKDILDFVGISNDKKIQSKAYWTYTKIIDSIENKIKYFNT